MGLGLFIFGAIIFILLIIISMFLIYTIFFKKPEDVNSNICLNFLSNYSNGRFLGLEKDVKEGKDGRKIITFIPKDIDILKMKKENNGKIDIKEEKVIVGKGKYYLSPKGELSKDRNISMYIPIRAEDLPDNLKNTELGIALMTITHLKDLKNIEINMLRQGNIDKESLLKKIGDGEISKTYLSYYDELIKDFLRAQLIAKEDKKSTSILGVSTQRPHE